jgi:hypothetical protein
MCYRSKALAPWVLPYPQELNGLDRTASPQAASILAVLYAGLRLPRRTYARNCVSGFDELARYGFSRSTTDVANPTTGQQPDLLGNYAFLISSHSGTRDRPL